MRAEEEGMREKTKCPHGDPRKFPCLSWILRSWSHPLVVPYLVLPRLLEPLSALTALVGNTPKFRGSGAGEHLESVPIPCLQAAGDAARGLVGAAPTLLLRVPVCRQLGTGAPPCGGSADPVPYVFRGLSVWEIFLSCRKNLRPPGAGPLLTELRSASTLLAQRAAS